MSRTKMAQPLRAILGLVRGLMNLHVFPSIESVLAKPHDERQKTTIPGFLRGKANPAVRTEDHYVEGRGGKIHTRVYVDPDTKPGAPGYLFIHGGGFVDGGVEHCDHVCSELAARSGYVVVGLSYRLAPEHPFPAGIEDCQDVLTWMSKERPGDLDADRLAVGGESAGANFTIALSLWARDNHDTGGPRIVHQAPLYPLTDFTMSLMDFSEGNAGNPGVTPELGDTMRKFYLPNGDYDNPMASVMFADLANLPPAYVITCGYDLLRNEGVAFVESLKKAGVQTTYQHFADMPHGFLLMSKLTKRANEAIDAMIVEANKHF